jgi:integrase
LFYLGGVGIAVGREVALGKPLSAAAVAKLKKQGRYGVGDGVYLQISKWKTRAWVFRYERFGKAHYMGLGPCHLISLAQARAKGRDAQRMLLDGDDPLSAKRQKRANEALRLAREQTFEQCAIAYLADHDVGWSAASSAQWRQSLSAYVFPVIGRLPVAEIDLPLILKVLEPIWREVPETANRVRSRLEAILGWATVRGLRTGDNPARWTNNLKHLLPSRSKFDEVEQFAALPYKDIGVFMQLLRAEQSVAARALEFIILTAARRGEVLNARWSEIQDGLWVPKERMKAGVEHRVVLSATALKLLAALPREGEYIFIGARAGQPLNHMSFRRLMAKLGYTVTVHGFRATFKTWASEMTAYPNHVVEQALAHTISNAVEAAYQRGDLIQKRRRLMEDWAKFCGRAATRVAGGEVVALRGVS